MSALEAAFAGCQAFEDPLALIADPDVDAVLIASPGFAHEEQVMACIEHRKPTLCEKPLAMDAESALRLVTAERQAAKASAGGVHAALRPGVCRDEAAAGLRRAGADVARAQRAPKQDRPGRLPVRDDRAGLAGA